MGALLVAAGDGARPTSRLAPLSLCALLTTLVLLFGLRGEQIMGQPLVIVLLALMDYRVKQGATRQGKLTPSGITPPSK
jgi:hypothetical protein